MAKRNKRAQEHEAMLNEFRKPRVGNGQVEYVIEFNNMDVRSAMKIIHDAAPQDLYVIARTADHGETTGNVWGCRGSTIIHESPSEKRTTIHTKSYKLAVRLLRNKWSRPVNGAAKDVKEYRNPLVKRRSIVYYTMDDESGVVTQATL